MCFLFFEMILVVARARRPAEGEVLDPAQSYTFEWDASQLFYFKAHGLSHYRSVVPITEVQVFLT
jgi:hypothetical protein